MLSKKRKMLLFAVLLIPAVALIMSASATEVWADPSECFFNIEFNATDLDAGVRGFFDYDPWNTLEIENPNSDVIAEVDALAGLAAQGFAEWFFESGEPKLGEPENGGLDYTFGILFGRFPDGTYTFTATPNAGGQEVCTADLDYVIPCAPEISASGNRGLGVIISWEEVDQVVDTTATTGDDSGVVCEDSEDLEIIGYKVIVEIELGDDEVVKIFDVDLLADDRSLHVSREFIALSDEFKYEVLAIDAGGNQTITEDEFCVNEINGQVEECEDEENGD